MDSPSPLPSGPLVVKKGSNAWAAVAASIPTPVSVTAMMTYAISSLSTWASSDSVPPLGIACAPLIARLSTAV